MCCVYPSSMCTRAYHVYARVSAEARRGSQIPYKAGVIGNCVLPGRVLGTKPRSSGRVASALNH